MEQYFFLCFFSFQKWSLLLQSDIFLNKVCSELRTGTTQFANKHGLKLKGLEGTGLLKVLGVSQGKLHPPWSHC
jgi:hypothetical protein